MKSIKILLLDLISERHVTQSQLNSLTEQDWQAMWQMASSHRITPLLYWQLQQKKLEIPTEWLDKYQASYKKSAMRSLKIQNELQKLHTILTDTGIRFVALKGTYLANNIYINPALRPMRDIDLLMPKEKLLIAFKKLISLGYTIVKKYQNTQVPESWLDISKHLPPLVSPNNIVVEIHDKLFHPGDWPGEDLTSDRNFWQRCTQISIANRQFEVISDTELLLHLIVHSSYDHNFNNGPLIFSDIAFLLQKTEIDWSFFWEKARIGGGTKGCQLVLSMVKYFYPSTTIKNLDTSKNLENDAIRFSLLSLQDYDVRGEQKILSFFINKSLTQNIKLLIKKAFPSKEKICTIYPTSTDSLDIYRYYIFNWIRLSKRIPSLLKVKNIENQHHSAKELSELERWLKE